MTFPVEKVDSEDYTRGSKMVELVRNARKSTLKSNFSVKEDKKIGSRTCTVITQPCFHHFDYTTGFSDIN